MYQLEYHPEVVGDIARLGTAERRRIKTAIETKLQTAPVQFGKPLQHSLSGLRSFRVGDYRVVFQLRVSQIFIVLIAHRSIVYTQVYKRTGA